MDGHNRFDFEIDELRNKLRNRIAENLDNDERVEFQDDFPSTNEDAAIYGVEKHVDGKTYILYSEDDGIFKYPLYESMESHDTLNMILEKIPEKE